MLGGDHLTRVVFSLGTAADPTSLRLLLAVAEQPGRTVKSCEELTGSTPSRILDRMQSLHVAGLVGRVGGGGGGSPWRYELTAAGAAVLAVEAALRPEAVPVGHPALGYEL